MENRTNTYTVMYAHLSRALVQKGDIVRQGKPIVVQGNTGYGTAPHLHLGLVPFERDVIWTAKIFEEFCFNGVISRLDLLIKELHYFTDDTLYEGEGTIITTQFMEYGYGKATGQGNKQHYGIDTISTSRKANPVILWNRSYEGKVIATFNEKEGGGYGKVVLISYSKFKPTTQENKQNRIDRLN